MVERCVRDAEVAGSNPVISTIETYNLVGKVKALTFVSAFLYYITIPILPYKLISVSIDFEIKKTLLLIKAAMSNQISYYYFLSWFSIFIPLTKFPLSPVLNAARAVSATMIGGTVNT